MQGRAFIYQQALRVISMGLQTQPFERTWTRPGTEPSKTSLLASRDLTSCFDLILYTYKYTTNLGQLTFQFGQLNIGWGVQKI